MERILAELGYSKDERLSNEPARTRTDPTTVRLDPDVAAIFKDDEMVNWALRKLIKIMSMVEEKTGGDRVNQAIEH